MKQGKAKYVFPGSNTPAGFVSYYQQGLQGLERVFIIKGGPGTGKSTLMRKIGADLLERGFDVEFWQCSSDNDSLDGVIVRQLSFGIIDGTAPHTIDPIYPGAVEEIINIGEHWDDQYLRQNKQAIIDITTKIKHSFEQGYAKLGEAGSVRRQKCALVNARINMPQLNSVESQLLKQIFKQKPKHSSRHLFSSAITPNGHISYGEALCRDYPHRYYLSGLSGAGQAELLEAIAHFAEKDGHNIEIYHHTLAPKQIELILLPDLGISVLDMADLSCDHIKGGTIIDCNDLLTDKAIDQAEKALDSRFGSLIKEASTYIAEAKSTHDQLELIYNKAMDFNAVEQTGNQLFAKILTIIEN